MSVSVCAGAVVRNQLPAGVGVALETDADAVHDRGQRQRGGERGGGALEAEETYTRRLQNRQRQARDKGPTPSPAAIPRQQAHRAER